MVTSSHMIASPIPLSNLTISHPFIYMNSKDCFRDKNYIIGNTVWYHCNLNIVRNFIQFTFNTLWSITMHKEMNFSYFFSVFRRPKYTYLFSNPRITNTGHTIYATTYAMLHMSLKDFHHLQVERIFKTWFTLIDFSLKRWSAYHPFIMETMPVGVGSHGWH